MSYYTDDELKNFFEYAKKFIQEKKKEENAQIEPEGLKLLNELLGLLDAMYFNAMLFESFVTQYAANKYLLEEDLEQLPLHINDNGILSEVIVKWRLENGK